MDGRRLEPQRGGLTGLEGGGSGHTPRAVTTGCEDPPATRRPMKPYHVTTFGCQMNEHDSERMKGMLESLGYARGAASATTPT